MDDNVLNHVSLVTHAHSLCTKLEDLYARKTGNNKLLLFKQLMPLRYNGGSPMTDHLNTFQGILNKLPVINHTFDDEIQGLWLLGTLPNSWDTFRTSLSNSAPNGIISMDVAKSIVPNMELRRKSQGSSFIFQGFSYRIERGNIKVEVQVIVGHHVVNYKEALIDSIIFSVINSRKMDT